MTLLDTATDTADADRLVRAGCAQAGDLIVSGSSGKLYRVDRVISSVNYAATDENGRAWKVRIAQARSAPVGSVFSGPAAADPAEVAGITLGTVVELEGKYAGRYAVIRDSGDTVSVARLGGDNGRYVRGVSKTRVTVVPASEL